MDPLSITTSIIAVLQATTSVISFLNYVKDPSKDLTRAELEASNLYSLLTQLKCRVAEPNFNEAWFASVRTLERENGPLDLYKAALKELQAKLSSKKIGSAIHWLHVKNDVAKILLIMERLKSFVIIALQMDHFKLSQTIQRKLTTVADEAIPQLKQSINAVQNGQEDGKRHQILAWISSNAYAAQKSDLINKKQQGTNQWFLDSPVFTAWATGSEKTTLWCPGLPGAGKTIMAATAIEHLSGKLLSQVAYVFCDFKEQGTQTATYLLSAIPEQLCSSLQVIPEPVVRMYERHSKTRTKLSLGECFSALEAIVCDFSNLYLVVDALDECTNQNGTRYQFLKRIRKLQSASTLRLMVTSRSVPEIAYEFERDSVLEVLASELGIKQYVNGQIYRLPKCIQRDIQLQHTIEDAIAQAAGGMFLLASLHVNFFLDKKTKAKIHSTLEDLPKGSEALNEAYDAALKRIESGLPGDTALAKTALSWIIHSQRSLTTQELCCAIAVEPGDAELDPSKVPDIEDIVSVCAGLVTVDKESNIVRLVHHTLQDYFLKFRTSWNPAAWQDIASTCFVQMTLKGKPNPFFAYAKQFWAYHAMHAEDGQPASRVLLNEKTFLSAAQALSEFNSGLKDYSQKPLENSVLRILGGGVPSSPQGDPVRSPNASTPNPTGTLNAIHMSAMLGLVEMLNTTLESKGNDPKWLNSVDPQGRTPLSYAAEFGQDKTAKALLNRDNIVINSTDYHGWTPLTYALKNGHKQLFELLLNREDIDVNIRPANKDTPLLLAVRLQTPELVELLIQQKEIEFNARDRSADTPLLLAVKTGHLEITELLLQAGVHVNARDSRHNTPLALAAKAGNLEIVELLLKQGVDVDARDLNGNTPLMLAVIADNLEMVELLLKQDSDINSRNKWKETPLILAINARSLKIVRLLLRRGEIDVNGKDSTGISPILLAVKAGSLEIVQLLLQRDVDFNTSNLWRETSLPMAATTYDWANQQVFELLINRRDLDISRTGKDGRTDFFVRGKSNLYSHD